MNAPIAESSTTKKKTSLRRMYLKIFKHGLIGVFWIGITMVFIVIFRLTPYSFRVKLDKQYVIRTDDGKSLVSFREFSGPDRQIDILIEPQDQKGRDLYIRQRSEDRIETVVSNSPSDKVFDLNGDGYADERVIYENNGIEIKYVRIGEKWGILTKTDKKVFAFGREVKLVEGEYQFADGKP